jgi:hypothetical protein
MADTLPNRSIVQPIVVAKRGNSSAVPRKMRRKKNAASA